MTIQSSLINTNDVTVFIWKISKKILQNNIQYYFHFYNIYIARALPGKKSGGIYVKT